MADGSFEDFMIEPAVPLQIGEQRTRVLLTRRLQDVVGLPSSRITPQERHMAADLLIEVLRESDTATRARCSERMALLIEAPALLLRFLARDEMEVARPLLEVCEAFDESDLIATATAPTATTEHRVLIARRKRISETVADVLVGFGEPEVVETLLRNEGATLAHPAMEAATAMSKTENGLIPLLVRRPELKPSQALTLFWWAGQDDRKRIFQRFAVERITLLEAAQDLFARAAKENWQDPLVRKSLQFIERRQRNRDAAARSPYGSLEGAVEALAAGPSLELFKEISFLAGVKPACGAQILSDPGGEAIAVMCKATGLKRRHFRLLWQGLRRPTGSDGEPAEAYARASYTYDTLSTNKAQTVLRYWNWALTSAMSPTLAAKLDQDDDQMAFSVSARSSNLVFGNPAN
jgi:uncharacterized protein (DUF2336 family)